MYIIVGLGNPGKEYEGTRHNAGFMVLDRLAEKYGIDVSDEKFKGLLGKGVVEENKVLLVKPQTYMNNSGECVRAVMDYYKADIDDLIVVFDDISLIPGRLRLRAKGSAGGHNGVKSLISHLGSDGFKRIKFGVGDKPKDWDLVDWVLGRFKEEDTNEVNAGLERACAALNIIMNEGIEAGMNRFNG